MYPYDIIEKSKAEWSKADMLEVIREVLEFNSLYTDENMNIFKKMKSEELFENCFEWTNWEYVESYRHQYDLYAVSEDSVICFVTEYL